MRRAFIDTNPPPSCPCQMSPIPPDSIGMSPTFSSPVERTADVGSRSVAPHTFPKAVINFAFCERIVGYAFVEIMKGFSHWKRMSRSDIPDRLCPQTSSDPPASVPERFAVVSCYPAKRQLVASSVRVSSYYSKTPGLRPPHGWNCGVR